eukprot:scaffold79647_cov59-Phaeocystis_antarctica.AAC.5
MRWPLLWNETRSANLTGSPPLTSFARAGSSNTSFAFGFGAITAQAERGAVAAAACGGRARPAARRPVAA